MIKSKQFVFIIFLLTSFITSCSRTDNTGSGEFAPPLSSVILTTNVVSSITSESAVAGGSITGGSEPITSRGICFNTSPDPTIANNTVASSSDTNNFSVVITGLTPNATYYVRAYATTSGGTAYGNQVTFIAKFAIGQNYQGGIVFYIDNTGQHGLIVATQDQGSATWGCSGTVLTGPAGKTIGSGASNTAAIVSQCATPGIAARVCDTLTLNSYTDWFLPSLDELEQVYNQRRAIGGTFNGNYWTSSQYDANNAYSINLTSNSEAVTSKSSTAEVRAVRSF